MSAASPNPTARRPWSDVVIPDRIQRLANMLSLDEKRYLLWLAGTQYQGWGAVVDLGCWMGSSSACLAEGMRQAGRPGRVQSFDLFAWDPGYMAQLAPNIDLPLGADFMPHFLAAMQPWADRIDAHKVDLTRYRWTGGPIEILFVDAAKSWGLLNYILDGFHGAIQPGRTRVVYQDFRFPLTPWLPLVMDSRPDLWRELESVAVGHTVTFHTLRPLAGPGGIPGPYSEDMFPFAMAERILRERVTRDPIGRGWYLRALYRLALLGGSVDDAARCRADLVACAEMPPSPEELRHLEDIWDALVTRGWRAFSAGDFAAAIDFGQRCLRHGRRPVYALSMLGMALLRAGRVAEAEPLLQEFARDSHGYEGELYLADLRLTQGRAQEALTHLATLFARMPADSVNIPAAFQLVTRAAAAGGLHARARQILATAQPGVAGLPGYAETVAALAAGGR